MRESIVEKRLKTGIKELGGWCIKFIPDIENGLPDQIIILPGGFIEFVETKAPRKVPRKLQLYQHKKLRRFGFKVNVLDTIKKVDDYVRNLPSL